MSYLRDLIWGPSKETGNLDRHQGDAKLRTSPNGTISVATDDLLEEADFIRQINSLSHLPARQPEEQGV